jgi:hypothetical protein
MKAALFALRSNELLGFVRLSHSAFPELPLSILSFNSPTAAWPFNAPYHQRSIPAQGSPHSSNLSTQVIFRFDQIQDD